MNILDPQQIESMARRFSILTTDGPRFDIIDQLGLQPLNHAWFARFLAACPPNAWQVYLDRMKLTTPKDKAP